MVILYFFILGSVIGSFLNVCIFRIPRSESITFPPSHCTNCMGKIKVFDLIPILSYLFLRGKCRYCGVKISIKYPLVELITGALFGTLYIKYGFSLEFIKLTVLICFLIVIGIIDYETTDVYSRTTYTCIVFGVVFIIASYFCNNNIMNYIFGGLFGGGIISIIIILTKGMGWGDAEICGLAGLFLGLKLTLTMMFLSFIIGGFWGIALIILKKKSRKDYIPFGPFITLATVLTVFIGDGLYSWYMMFIYQCFH